MKKCDILRGAFITVRGVNYGLFGSFKINEIEEIKSQSADTRPCLQARPLETNTKSLKLTTISCH